MSFPRKRGEIKVKTEFCREMGERDGRERNKKFESVSRRGKKKNSVAKHKNQMTKTRALNGVYKQQTCECRVWPGRKRNV